MSYTKELKHLNLKTRNRLRSVLTLSANEAINRLNEIRRRGTAGELVQVDRVLWASPASETPLIPALFPSQPQTAENYNRLDPVSLDLQLKIIELHVRSNLPKVQLLIAAIADLNNSIVTFDFDAAASQCVRIRDSFGFSHFLLRKAALLRVLASTPYAQEVAEKILISAGLSENNHIASTLVQCYQEEQDFLSMKRSIMNLPDRGLGNKFTRDTSRIPFHPYACSEDDLRDHLQSALQSSLLDALLIAKFNSHIIALDEFPSLTSIFNAFDDASPNLDAIARLQPAVDPDSEHIFYKRTSAWLECSDIARYRLLLDHFYDSPEAKYFEITDNLLSQLEGWTDIRDLDSLATSTTLTQHTSQHLHVLENSGTMTRSALFNYCLHLTQGYTTVGEDHLIYIMGHTQDLAKTIPSTFATNLAKSVGSEISKLVIYLLIAKKSRNERDDHLLRKSVQEITIQHFNRSLVALLEYLNSRSTEVAHYAYEVFTEDFIAKLYDLITSSSEVTDTRASLHRWMGHNTGDKSYLDRARTLLIDHQLNKVRNEIDDNRIYVDVARFQEWINEELFRDISAALNSVDRKNFESNSTDSIISILIERCYLTFCSHKAFGISSYLGRRIRHGTFKGHLYSGVVCLENEKRFARLLEDPQVNKAWNEWKANYETKIDDIIKERLHVASSTKRDGLLKPSLLTPQKIEIISACSRALLKDYLENKTSAATSHIITEYCWRLAEVDLKSFNAYLKGQRRSLVEAGGLSNIKASAPSALSVTANDFYRAVARAIIEKLMAMQMWFKRPLNVSPKASLSLLYKAVVEEVRATYPSLPLPRDLDADQDVELFGGAYHILYDSFYVVVYNAAKHGKIGGAIDPKFSIVLDSENKVNSVLIEISSEIKDDEDESIIQRRLHIGPEDDIDNAQTYENRSGIPKLYQLQNSDPSFSIKDIRCSDRRVIVTLTYQLEH